MTLTVAGKLRFLQAPTQINKKLPLTLNPELAFKIQLIMKLIHMYQITMLVTYH